MLGLIKMERILYSDKLLALLVILLIQILKLMVKLNQSILKYHISQKICIYNVRGNNLVTLYFVK